MIPNYQLAYKLVDKNYCSINVKGRFQVYYPLNQTIFAPHPDAPLFLFRHYEKALSCMNSEESSHHVLLCLAENERPLPPWRDLFELWKISTPEEYFRLHIFSNLIFPDGTVAYQVVQPLRVVFTKK